MPVHAAAVATSIYSMDDCDLPRCVSLGCLTVVVAQNRRLPSAPPSAQATAQRPGVGMLSSILPPSRTRKNLNFRNLSRYHATLITTTYSKCAGASSESYHTGVKLCCYFSKHHVPKCRDGWQLTLIRCFTNAAPNMTHNGHASTF